MERDFWVVSSQMIAMGMSLFATVAAAESRGAEPAATTSDLVMAISASASDVAGDAEQLGPMRMGHLAERGVERFALTVSPSQCITVIGRGAPSISNLDLVLFEGASDDERGRPVAQDRAVSSSARVSRCFGRRTKLAIEVRATGGSGAFAAAVFAKERAAEVARGDDITSRSSAAPVGGRGTGYLAVQLRAAHGRLDSGRPLTDRIDGMLETGKRDQHTVELRQGRCYAVLGVGVPSVRVLELSLIDPFGAERGRSERRSMPAVVRICPTASGRFQVVTGMFQGYGRYAIQAFEAPAP